MGGEEKLVSRKVKLLITWKKKKKKRRSRRGSPKIFSPL
jgi:hypothetical protein